MVILIATGASAQVKLLKAQSLWPTADGSKVNPLLTKKRPAVLLFMMTDCPISNMYAPEVNRIVKAYRSRVAFTFVYVDASLTAASARKHNSEYGLSGTTVLDPTHSLAKRVGATVSPEVVVLDASGRIAYRGRIDDRVVTYGKIRPEPKQRDLRLTLDLLLAGKWIVKNRTAAVGCVFRSEKS